MSVRRAPLDGLEKPIDTSASHCSPHLNFDIDRKEQSQSQERAMAVPTTGPNKRPEFSIARDGTPGSRRFESGNTARVA
jgi:hypothetical protein